MAQYSRKERDEILQKAAEINNSSREESVDKLRKFLKEDIEPNAPGIIAFLENLSPETIMHPTLGFNPHPISCGRCGRSTPLIIPLGSHNAIWSCSSCNIEMYGSQEDFMSCPSCKQVMTQTRVFKTNEPVSFDYFCKTCRDNNDAQLEISCAGGALVVCPVCSTTGTLPATDKQVQQYRKSNNLSPDQEVRFVLRSTQCPRCADVRVERVFLTEEQNRITLHTDDLLDGFHKDKKGSLTNVKKSKKSPGVVGRAKPKKTEVPPAKKEVFFSHPGSKSFN